LGYLTEALYSLSLTASPSPSSGRRLRPQLFKASLVKLMQYIEESSRRLDGIGFWRQVDNAGPAPAFGFGTSRSFAEAQRRRSPGWSRCPETASGHQEQWPARRVVAGQLTGCVRACGGPVEHLDAGYHLGYQFHGQSARPQDEGRIDRQVEHGALDADGAASAIDYEVNPVAKLGHDMLRPGR